MKVLPAILFIAGLFAATDAEACRIPPRFFIPIVGEYEAVFLATATSLDGRGANLRIDDMLDGHMPARSIHADFATGDVDFEERGPPGDVVITMACDMYHSRVEAGMHLVVAVRRQGNQFLASWMAIEDAALADDFFRLYPRASDPAEKRRLLARWRLGNSGVRRDADAPGP